MAKFPHLTAKGEAHMVDVSDKRDTARLAIAIGTVEMRAQTLELLVDAAAQKGDVLSVARVAGIMGAKKTADLVPLCHPVPVDKVTLDLTPDAGLPGIRIKATVKTTGKTGVEMEALTAVSTAALTIYDMLKAQDRGMVISDIRLVLKDGGKSGRFEA